MIVWKRIGDSAAKKKVLFLCTANSCRSQMAEGLLRHFYGGRFDAYSAGAMATFVHPLAVKSMKEIGIDISSQRSKSIAEFAGWTFDYVITTCGGTAKDVCPAFIGKARKRLYWNFGDPAGAHGTDEEKMRAFRKMRDQIKAKIDEFVLAIDK